MAAGGIVMRREQPPLIAVVRLRKRDEWVLPKGKLDEGETARAAARREVLEETGHNVTVHEFLGTLVYESGGRSKVVHYWRMEAGGTQTRELMNDIRAVDWLPLDEALVRLSRGYERTFLENVGPLAVSVLSRRLKAKAQAQAQTAVAKAPPALKAPPVGKAPLAKAAPAKKRRVKPPVVAPQPQIAEPVAAPLAEPELLPDTTAIFASDAGMPEVPVEPELSQAPARLVDEEFVPQLDDAEAESATDALTEDDASEDGATESEAAESDAAQQDGDDPHDPDGKSRKSLAQKVRNWLGRAA
jgi:8-oxo-dGTP diphosphatase